MVIQLNAGELQKNKHNNDYSCVLIPHFGYIVVLDLFIGLKTTKITVRALNNKERGHPYSLIWLKYHKTNITIVLLVSENLFFDL